MLKMKAHNCFEVNLNIACVWTQPVSALPGINEMKQYGNV